MSALTHQLRGLARLGRRSRVVREERGFTLIEMVVAASIFIGVAAALAGLLGSAIVAHDLSRERTFAQQAATAQIECIRRLAYQDVGLWPSGNPTGKIGYTGGGDYCKSGTFAISKTGLTATMATTVDYVDDPTPTGFASAANYKRVTVQVTRADGTILASQVTFVAPIQRAPYGGRNNAILNVTVADFVLNSPLTGATVSLASGPSAPRSDVTDSTGLASFAALTPTTTTGAATDYYDITAALGGYTTIAADLPPAAEAHKQLAPSDTKPATIRLYRGATINVNLTDGSGGPAYSGPVTVKVTSAYTNTTQSYAVSGGATSIATFGGVPVVPNQNYTIRAYTAGGLCADPVSQVVAPSATYPGTLSASYTLALKPCDVGSLTVNVNQLGLPANLATVTISGGPNDYTAITQSTNASGQTTFTNLPAGTDTYSISVSKLYTTGTATAVVNTGATTSVTVNLPDPPVGNIRAHVQWPTASVVGASVHLTGGPAALDITLNTDGAGDAVFTDLPSGTGYTLDVTDNGITKTVTGISVSTATTTATTITMPVANITVNVTWAGQTVGSGASVTITGGPMGGSYTGTTNSSGVATISVPQAVLVTDTYTVAASKGSGSGSTTVAAVPSTGATANVAFTQVGTITATATWLSLFSAGASVSITGGPITGVTYGSGTTTAAGTGVAPAITVPITSSTAYTVTVTKAGASATGTVSTVTLGGNVNTPAINMTTPSKTLTITIQRNSAALVSASVIVSITGGPNGTAGSAPAYGGTYTTSSTGVLPAITVPSGSGGYTIKAYLSPCSLFSTYRSGSTTAVSTGTTNTNVTLNFTTSAAACPFSPLP